MPLRVLIAAVLSALAMFVCGCVYWGPVMNVTSRLTRPLPPDHELDVLAPMRAADAPDGMYAYPGPPPAADDKAAVAAWEKKQADGPLLLMAYQSKGAPPMAPATLANGFLHSFVLALLGGVMLATVCRGLSGFAGRFGVLALASLMAALWTPIGDMIWWLHPPRFALAAVLYTLVAGLLMAAITAAIVKPSAVPDSRPAKL